MNFRPKIEIGKRLGEAIGGEGYGNALNYPAEEKKKHTRNLNSNSFDLHV